MKTVIRNTISVIAILLLVIGGLFFLSDLTERKESKGKFEGFYTNEEEYEVLFIGSSHVLNGIFPMELWKEYGITSYNLSGHGNRMALNYWILRNALVSKNPKLVVIDTYMIGREDKLESLEQLHYSADHIPFGELKVEMIEDLVEEEERREDFLWNFSTYHHRWNELSKEDFVKSEAVEKGAESRINVAKTEENMVMEDKKVISEKTINMEYLDKMIELCHEKEIEVLLTYLPFPDTTGWRIESNTVEELAKEYRVDFLSFDTLYQVIDRETDFYDKDSHMNPSGAKKITSYLGNYIISNYEVTDYREWEEYENWYEDEQRYDEFKLEKIKAEEELKNTLMLLNDRDLSYGIYLKPRSRILEYPILVKLLGNMGIDYSQIPNEDYFLIKDRIYEKEAVLRLFETVDTTFGEFSLFYNEDGHLELTCSKADSMIITFSDIAIVVFDNYDLGVETQKSFNLSEIDQEFWNDNK